MAIEVHDNREASRYEVWADGKLAGFTQYRLHDTGSTSYTRRSTRHVRAKVWAVSLRTLRSMMRGRAG